MPEYWMSKSDVVLQSCVQRQSRAAGTSREVRVTIGQEVGLATQGSLFLSSDATTELVQTETPRIHQKSKCKMDFTAISLQEHTAA